MSLNQQLVDYAYDPLAWAQLINQTSCIGIPPATIKKLPCMFPAIPQSGQITWTCPAGSFCVGKKEITSCTPGFYCPENSIQPVYCPPGYYCKDPTSVAVCPLGQFCPRGTVKPKSCGIILAYCPEGSSTAPKFLVLLVFLIIALAIYFLYQWKAKTDMIRESKRKSQLDQTALKARLDDKPDIKALEKTFTIEFDDLGLKLPNGIEIMKGVSGTLYSGRTCAIMGPSGAGKTTFVTLLTGKVSRTSGSVKLNGKPDELSNYSKLIGYVPQEDIMIRELTVRDILMHSARMRLPRSWPYPQVKEKVNEIITFLGMSHVSSSIIGNEEERGVSGGQRKRVNIGMELCAEPSVLFLDEPTSGLDSSTSFDVCQNLRQIAIQQGLTVAAVIHSPSPATFRQFDDFLLLGKGGRVIYMGPREGALGYFEAIGFTCPPVESPSDYFMDVATGVVPSEFEPGFVPTDLFTYWEQRANIRTLFANKRRMTAEEAILAAKEYHRLTPTLKAQAKKEEKTEPAPKQETLALIVDFAGKAFSSLAVEAFEFSKDVGLEFLDFLRDTARAITGRNDPVRNTQPFYLQLWFLIKRAFNQVYRDVGATMVDLAMNFAAGIFISIAIQSMGYLGGNPEEICAWAPYNLFYQCKNPTDTLKIAGMFISLGSMFAGISIAGNTFGREKVVYWRDTAAGMPVLPYYLAKVIVDIPRIILGAISYFIALIMFFPYAQSWVNLLGMILMLHFYSFALGYALSTAVTYQKLSLYGVGLSLLWALVLSGVNPSLNDVSEFPSIIAWVWKVSVPRWMIEAFYIKEVTALPFKERNLPNGPDQYLWDNYGSDFYHSIAITLGWHVLAILGLKVFNRIKQK
ncbi:hypothetical protein HDV03_003654 [Kappamyces sp. JEL0829]|nr:hypothetical protein HDV03_003654 [Kappamyces sp. JEL0829]